MKRLIQICLIVVVLTGAVSCAPSGAVVSGGVGVGVGAYPAPMFVPRPYYGFYRPYYYRPFVSVHPIYRFYHPAYGYHYRR